MKEIKSFLFNLLIVELIIIIVFISILPINIYYYNYSYNMLITVFIVLILAGFIGALISNFVIIPLLKYLLE